MTKIRNKKKIVSYVISGGNVPPNTHCTLWYQPYRSIKRNPDESDSSFDRRKKQLEDKRNAFFNMIGTEIMFEELIILKNDRVMTLVLGLENQKLYNGLSSPHITLETYEDAKPNESNNLIQEHEELLNKHKEESYEFKGYLSAMYYSSEGKSYSTTTGEWK
jgi:hypothetical protein